MGGACDSATKRSNQHSRISPRAAIAALMDVTTSPGAQASVEMITASGRGPQRRNRSLRVDAVPRQQVLADKRQCPSGPRRPGVPASDAGRAPPGWHPGRPSGRPRGTPRSRCRGPGPRCRPRRSASRWGSSIAARTSGIRDTSDTVRSTAGLMSASVISQTPSKVRAANLPGRVRAVKRNRRSERAAAQGIVRARSGSPSGAHGSPAPRRGRTARCPGTGNPAIRPACARPWFCPRQPGRRW